MKKDYYDNWVIILLGFFLILSPIWVPILVYYPDAKKAGIMGEKIKKGEITLRCKFKEGGWRPVQPEKFDTIIIGDDGTEYLFKNGSAKNCRVIKVPYHI